MLHSDELAFVLVTAAQYNQTYACQSFVRELEEVGMAVHAMVVNRVLPTLDAKAFTAEDTRQLNQILASFTASQQADMREAIDHQIALAKRDQTLVSLLQESRPNKPLFVLPNLPHDKSDLANLATLYQVFLKSHLKY